MGNTYPHSDGEFTILGPEIFASNDGEILCWKGENYVRQTEVGASTPVVALYDRWVKAGPPPLGTSMSRWWDKRLVELHEAIRSTPDDTTSEK